MYRIVWIRPILCASIALFLLSTTAQAGVRARQGDFALSVDHGFVRFEQAGIVVQYDTKDQRIMLASRDDALLATAQLAEACKAARRVQRSARRPAGRDPSPALGSQYLGVEGRRSETVVGPREEVSVRGEIDRVRTRFVDDGERIAGLASLHYEVQADDVLYSEVWISSSPEIRDALETVDWQVLSAFARCGLGPALFDHAALVVDAVESRRSYLRLMQRGLILRSRRVGELQGSEFDSVTTQTIPIGFFATPRSYREIGFRSGLEQLLAALEDW
ncbi:MAG: hypothetical protein AAGJ56_00220 [Myxococcota bacterium]